MSIFKYVKCVNSQFHAHKHTCNHSKPPQEPPPPQLKGQKLDHSKKRKEKKETVSLPPVSPVSHQKYPLPATSIL